MTSTAKSKKTVAKKKSSGKITKVTQKKSSISIEQPKKKIFIIYLNDPDRTRAADLIHLVDTVANAKHSNMNRSKYVTRLIVNDLIKRGVLRKRVTSKT